MAAGGHKVIAVKLDDWTEMIGINSKKHLAKANAILQHRIMNEHMINGVMIVNPNAAYIERHVTIGSDTVIQPFTTLRGRTKIGVDCQIGPFVDLIDAEIEDGAIVKGKKD